MQESIIFISILIFNHCGPYISPLLYYRTTAITDFPLLFIILLIVGCLTSSWSYGNQIYNYIYAIIAYHR